MPGTSSSGASGIQFPTASIESVEGTLNQLVFLNPFLSYDASRSIFLPSFGVLIFKLALVFMISWSSCFRNSYFHDLLATHSIISGNLVLPAVVFGGGLLLLLN